MQGPLEMDPASRLGQLTFCSSAMRCHVMLKWRAERALESLAMGPRVRYPLVMKRMNPLAVRSSRAVFTCDSRSPQAKGLFR